MRKLATLCFLLLSLQTYSQSNYVIYQIPFNPDTTVVFNDINLMDDMYSGLLPIGFNFMFYGATYDSLCVGSNGIISFDSSNAYTICPWTTNTATASGIKNSILAPWQDLLPDSATIKYALAGTAPFRKMIIYFDNIPMFSCSTIFSQQVILYETTQIIETHIFNKTTCAWNYGRAVHGIINQSGNFANIVPGRNNTSWVANNEGMRFDPNIDPIFNNYISGKVYQDINGNCILDSNETGIPNRTISMNNGTYLTQTDVDGNYSFIVDTGTYVITKQTSPYYSSNCPLTGFYTVNFSSQLDTSSHNDFSDEVLQVCADLQVNIGASQLISCSEQLIHLGYCNNGTIAETGVMVNFTLHDSIQIVNMPSNIISLGNNNYEINIGSLSPGACGSVDFQVQIGCDSLPGLYCLQAQIEGDLANDCDTTNNVSLDCHLPSESYNTNHLRVAAQQFSTLGYVINDFVDNNDEITYLVRFQNLGNGVVYNLKVRDFIPSQLNPSSLTFISSSHNYYWTMLPNNEILIAFDNINLPTYASDPVNSSGYIKFSLQQDFGNTPGSTIVNKARIYFNNNSVIITNETVNTVVADIGYATIENKNIELMPNPVEDQFQLTVPFEISENTEISINDLLGNKVLLQTLTNTISNIQCRDLSKGMYIVCIYRNGEVCKQFKIVKK